ncbi:MAG: hypothetical protein HXX11_15560, partial [Desulfuromonadales bacterium]|nr:hypothetical protein [Desulfuromonadales bacterium]
ITVTSREGGGSLFRMEIGIRVGREKDLNDLGLKYIHEKELENEETGEPDIELTPEQLTEILPADLRNELHTAILRLDTARTLDVIDLISGRDSAVGAVLKKLADALAYDRLLALTEDTGTNKETIT